MPALNEARAWDDATADYGGVREWHAYERATTDLTATFPDPEDMPSMAPEPPRQVNVLVTATVALLIVAALLGWWIS